MSEERTRILEMLAEGKISAEDAGRLLDRVGARSSGSASTTPSAEKAERAPSATAVAVIAGGRKSALRFLRVLVDGAEGEQVNIRIPLAFVRTGIKFSTMLPTEVGQKLSTKGIDLSHLSQLQGEDLMEALRDLKIDVDSANGDKVRIFCE